MQSNMVYSLCMLRLYGLTPHIGTRALYQNA